MIRAALLLCLMAGSASAEILVPTTTIRAQSVIGPSHVKIVEGDMPGVLADPAMAVGLEARVTLYAGRPIRSGDVGPPALVDRNQVVTLVYQNGGIRITADGRALDRAGVGDRLRIMNLDSRTTVTGQIGNDGTIYVNGGPQ